MKIENECKKIISELYNLAKIKPGDILVVGCSTSEVVGNQIGKNSNIDVANKIFGVFYEFCQNHNIFLAAQCCEHLNRCLVVERNSLTNYEEVNVVPQMKAGGAFATTAYQNFKDPIVVESIKADAGIDIGDTLIGMHLKSVAVPVRLPIKKIGKANVVCARVRPKYVGGPRAVYNEKIM